MDNVTNRLKEHYSQRFASHGATPRGVDWSREEDVCIRYDKMLAVVDSSVFVFEAGASLLDVGCGYGGLYLHAKERNIALDYTGIDVAANMIEYAGREIPEAEFRCQSIFELDSGETFDYVVCNGILTQKLSTSIREMDEFAQNLIKKMFALCKKGIAFNVMTTKVNFMVDNLYYKNPVELFAYCFIEISEKIRLDHSYPLYEYTVYLYRQPE